MIKVLFICHGNICRSPMAEYIFKNLINNIGLTDYFEVSSAATSREEIGNDIYPPAKRVMTKHGIPFDKRQAWQITERDVDYYDHIIAMDQNNLRNLQRMFGLERMKKVSLLMDYTDRPGNVSDPWYTGDFDTAFQDIKEGCEGLLNMTLYSKENDEE